LWCLKPSWKWHAELGSSFSGGLSGGLRCCLGGRFRSDFRPDFGRNLLRDLTGQSSNVTFRKFCAMFLQEGPDVSCYVLHFDAPVEATSVKDSMRSLVLQQFSPYD
jgi:hypothetical protein